MRWPFLPLLSAPAQSPFWAPAQRQARAERPKGPERAKTPGAGLTALPPRWQRRPPVQPPTGAGDGATYTQIPKLGKRKGSPGKRRVRSRSRRDSLGGCSTCSGGCTLTATQIRVSADYPVNSWPIKLPAPAGTPIWSWLVPWGGTTEDRHLPIEEPAMYGNILSQITQFLTPDVIAKLAQGARTSDRAAAQKAVGAAVPTILSGLAGLAAKPDGAASWPMRSPGSRGHAGQAREHDRRDRSDRRHRQEHALIPFRQQHARQHCRRHRQVRRYR